MCTIICTTGTSVAQGVPRLTEGGDAQAYRQAIRQRWQELQRSTTSSQEFLRRVSAESNSLSALKTTGTDHVVLLHSETEDGRICAEQVRDLLQESVECQTELRCIKGLQVHDAERFRRIGIQNLFAELDRLCHALEDPQHTVFLNATGGFKSTVPYLTLYGLLYRLPVIYIFERSNTLVTLPPAPIHFDYERLSQAMDALQQLRQAGAMTKDKFFDAIPGLPYDEREWYESLLEEEGGLVTLSAFGGLLTDALAREQSRVLVSQKALQKYNESSGTTREQFTFMLERVRNPLWRQGKVHLFRATDLTVYKPGNTAERMACVVQGDKVFVCELFGDHDNYERVLRRKRIADYDLKEFVPWSRPSDQPEPASSEAEAFRQLRQRCQELEECWRGTEQQVNERQKQCDDLTRACDDWKQQLETERQRTEGLVQELEQCRRQLAQARRPWWKRLFG